MDLMELKYQTKRRMDALNVRLSDIYNRRQIGERSCFLLPDGTVIALGGLPTFGAIVIEYADNYDEAKRNRFEDGDLFYLEKMDEEAMFQAMLREIRQ